MSAFEEASEAERKRQWLPPSPLQIAWLVVLLVFAGIALWLALSPPPALPEKPQLASAVSPAKPTLPARSAAAAVDAPQAPSAPSPAPAPVVATPLSPAPAEGLVEKSPFGPLPKIDGAREPWQVYAHPFEQTAARPRIALLISGLGMSKRATDAAISALPPQISLAFSPYGHNLQTRVDAARKAGHEVLLLVPMEPENYPKNDPGPQTLLTTLPMADNLDRLHWVMSRFAGYVGLVNDMGSRYTASEEAMTPVLEDLKARGLLFMDARSSQYSVAAKLARDLRVPRVLNNRFLDSEHTEENIRKQLKDLESVAKTYGAAAGIGSPYPLTIRLVAEWAATLSERGFDLAPITAVASRQPVR